MSDATSALPSGSTKKQVLTPPCALKQLAGEVDRPLAHLAVRWVLQQPGINTAVVGAKNSTQVEDNVAALAGDIPEPVFERMTAISDDVMQFMPATGNVYRYYP